MTKRNDLINLIEVNRINILKEKKDKNDNILREEIIVPVEKFIEKYIIEELYIDYLDTICEKYFGYIPTTKERCVIYVCFLNKKGAVKIAAEIFLFDKELKAACQNIYNWYKRFNNSGKLEIKHHHKDCAIKIPTNKEVNETIRKIYFEFPRKEIEYKIIQIIILREVFNIKRQKDIQKIVTVSLSYISQLLKKGKEHEQKIKNWVQKNK